MAKTKTDDQPTAKLLRICQVRSTIGTKPGHAETIRGLGLRGIRTEVEREDNPAIRGMLAKVGYLLKVSEVER